MNKGENLICVLPYRFDDMLFNIGENVLVEKLYTFGIMIKNSKGKYAIIETNKIKTHFESIIERRKNLINLI